MKELTQKQLQGIQQVEKLWKMSAKQYMLEQAVTIDRMTGFISPDGTVIPIEDRSHVYCLSQLEEEAKVSDDEYLKVYGAIRVRPGHVFILTDMPPRSMNVEIHKTPTPAQVSALSKMDCTIMYEFWGDGPDRWCPKEGVSVKKFIKELKRYWKI